MTIDYTDYTEDELFDIIEGAKTEVARRQSKSAFDSAIAKVIRGARGEVIPEKGVGEDWEPVTSYEDVYLKGDRVRHNGTRWTSNIDNNAGEPGVSGWAEDPEPDEDGNPRYPVWTGGGYENAYEPGAIVWHPDEGDQLYRNDHTDKNGWEPGTPGSQWTEVDEDDL